MYKILGTNIAIGFYRSKTTPIIVLFGPHRQDIEELFAAIAGADKRIAASERESRETKERIKKGYQEGL